jgi:Fe-S-cluster containining protein
MPAGTAPAAIGSADELLPIAHELIAADTAMIAADHELSCRAGCGACCRQAVPVTPAEVRHIRDHLEALPTEERHLFETRIAEVREELNVARAGTQVVDMVGYFRLGVACPFLVDESCGIHAARPLACREYVVTSDPVHCQALGSEQIVRLSARRDVVAGFGRASAAFGEDADLVLTLAMADPEIVEAATPAPQRKSGVAMMRMLTETPRA